MTTLVLASTVACSSSAMLKQHSSTCLSRLAQHIERVESCRDVTNQVEFGLTRTQCSRPIKQLPMVIPGARAMYVHHKRLLKNCNS